MVLTVGAENVGKSGHLLAGYGERCWGVFESTARAKRSQERGARGRKVSLEEALSVVDPGQDLIAVDDALQAPAQVDARKSQVVEMRFFGGLSVQETAEALKVSPDTVMRDWKVAKAWLLRELAPAQGKASGNARNHRDQ